VDVKIDKGYRRLTRNDSLLGGLWELLMFRQAEQTGLRERCVGLTITVSAVRDVQNKFQDVSVSKPEI
jgi:hypothetical protein